MPGLLALLLSEELPVVLEELEEPVELEELEELLELEELEELEEPLPFPPMITSLIFLSVMT